MSTPSVERLKVKIFADGADIKAMREAAANPVVKGFTTNPSLMRQAGVNDYKAFALDVLKLIPDRPISFEVFADDFPTMEAQAREIATWGANIYVKIPVSNTKGEFAGPLIASLSRTGDKAQRHGHLHPRAGVSRRRSARGERSRRGFGVRRSHRRHRARSGPAHGGASFAQSTEG